MANTVALEVIRMLSAVWLMLSTLLSPVIGYARAAEAAQKADRENCTLKEACLSLGYLDGETFDALFAPFLKPENESPEGEK